MMNVYSFKTLENIKFVMAENITDALKRAESLLDQHPKGRKTYNQIAEAHLVASDVYVAPEALKKLSTLELQTGD